MVEQSAKLAVRKSVIFSHSLIVKLLVKDTLLTSRGNMFNNNLLTNVAFLKAYFFNASYILLHFLPSKNERNEPP